MNQVDQGGSSTGLPPKPTSTGSFTYVNGQMVWVPKTITLPKKPNTPLKPITVTPATSSQNAGAPTSAYTPPMTDYIPPAPKTNGHYTYVNGKMVWVSDGAKPLDMTDYAGFEQQDSAAASLGMPTTETKMADLSNYGEFPTPFNPWSIYKPTDLGLTDPYHKQATDSKGNAYWYVVDANGNYIPSYQDPTGKLPFALDKDGNKIPVMASSNASGMETPLDAYHQLTQGQIFYWEPKDKMWHIRESTTPSVETTDNNGSSTDSSQTGDLPLEQPTLPDITWEEKYHVEGAPDWWRGMIPDRYDAQSEYASMLNSMIPFMSPEDQRYAASFLFRMYPQYFASYSSFASNETIPQAPSELTTDQRQYMTSYQRAQSILDTLEKVKQISGNPKLGPGYAYLQELGSVLRDYGARGTGNSQTRQQYQQMMGALDPLVAENQQENLSAYSALTRMLTQPYYTAGQIHPTTTLQDNSVISGTPIKNYF